MTAATLILGPRPSMMPASHSHTHTHTHRYIYIHTHVHTNFLTFTQATAAAYEQQTFHKSRTSQPTTQRRFSLPIPYTLSKCTDSRNCQAQACLQQVLLQLPHLLSISTPQLEFTSPIKRHRKLYTVTETAHPYNATLSLLYYSMWPEASDNRTSIPGLVCQSYLCQNFHPHIRH